MGLSGHMVVRRHLHTVSLSAPSSPTLVSCQFDKSHSNRWGCYLIVASLVINDAEHLFMDLLAICMSSLKQSLQVLCPFVNQTGVFAGFCFRAGEGGWGGVLKPFLEGSVGTGAWPEP